MLCDLHGCSSLGSAHRCHALSKSTLFTNLLNTNQKLMLSDLIEDTRLRKMTTDDYR